MPFDPNLPLSSSRATSAELRSQFNGLKELIDSMSGITSVVVDAVNTLPPGTAAGVSMNVIDGELHFTFGIPQGETGAQGGTGNDGGTGPQGPPFASALVDAVNTVDPGTPAAVGVNFDGTNVRFTFSIPRGNDGATGATGQPGEVSLTDLNNAIATSQAQTSNNSNAVATLDTPMADPESEVLRQKVDDLIHALRR